MSTVWTGLTIGALYALVAVAYNVVFLSTGAFNFAQAQFLMLGTFIAYTGLTVAHLPLAAVIAGGFVIGGIVGALEERVAIRPIQGLGVHGELITTLGVAVLLSGLATLIWGANPLPVPFPWGEHPLDVLGGRILPSELTLVLLGCTIAIGAELISHRTTLGLTSLATAEDRVAATVRGIDVGRLSIGSFLAAGGLAAAIGPFVGPTTFAFAGLGDVLALKGFVALAVGGQGSQKGALIGGLVTGLVEALTGRYLGVDYQNLAVFALLLLVLMVRPAGLFGEADARLV